MADSRRKLAWAAMVTAIDTLLTSTVAAWGGDPYAFPEGEGVYVSLAATDISQALEIRGSFRKRRYRFEVCVQMGDGDTEQAGYRAADTLETIENGLFNEILLAGTQGVRMIPHPAFGVAEARVQSKFGRALYVQAYEISETTS